MEKNIKNIPSLRLSKVYSQKTIELDKLIKKGKIGEFNSSEINNFVIETNKPNIKDNKKFID